MAKEASESPAPQDAPDEGSLLAAQEKAAEAAGTLKAILAGLTEDTLAAANFRSRVGGAAFELTQAAKGA